MSSSSIQRTVSFEPAAVKTRKTVQRRTSFATISVREYEQTIGDSPSCLEGAPVTLGWSFQENRDISIEEYEQSRQPFRRRRRSDLILGVNERRTKLIESGVALSDVLRAENFSALKKKAVRVRGSSSRMGLDGKEQLGVGTRTINHVVSEGAPKTKELKEKEKLTGQRRVSPPLQKQMASRAA